MYRTIIHLFLRKRVKIIAVGIEKNEGIIGSINEEDDTGILFKPEDNKYPSSMLITWGNLIRIEDLETML